MVFTFHFALFTTKLVAEGGGDLLIYALLAGRSQILRNRAAKEFGRV